MGPDIWLVLEKSFLREYLKWGLESDLTLQLPAGGDSSENNDISDTIEVN